MNIRAEHVRYSHTSRSEPPVEVFRDLTLSISPGQRVGMIGREGSGKTTLLNLLGGLIAPAAGKVVIDGEDAHRCGKAVRLRMGFTFQFPEEQFLGRTVAEEFGEMLRIRGVSPQECNPRMGKALEAMGLDPGGLPERSPFSLSLGESRRLALALLVAIRPEAAFLDEPTSGLDASGIARAQRALEGLGAGGATLVIATHDVDFLAGIAGRVLVLGEGGIAADGEAGEILADDSLLARQGYAVPERVLFDRQERERGDKGGR